MRITHIVDIDLAANNWSIVADQMLAGAAGDNWQQPETGTLHDYPRLAALTLLTRSPSRSTIVTRIDALLNQLDARRDYRANPLLRLTITDPSNVTRWVPIDVRGIRVGTLQTTGTDYVATITFDIDVLLPPMATTPTTITPTMVLPYHIVDYTASTADQYWAPATLKVEAVPASFLGLFGGVWVAERGRGAPTQTLQSWNIPNSTPSSTAITFGSGTARQMNSPSSTFVFAFTLFPSVPPPIDVWISVLANAATTVRVIINDQLTAIVPINANQLCYYTGRIFSNIFQMTIEVVQPPANTVLFPVIFAHTPVTRAVWRGTGNPVGTTTLTMDWGNAFINLDQAIIRGGNNTPGVLIGPQRCELPAQGRLIVAYADYIDTVDIIGNRYALAPGVL